MNPITEAYTPPRKRIDAPNNWREWTGKQAERLEKIIAEMMENQGYVIMSVVSLRCYHSVAACDSKARAMKLNFTVKAPREPYRPPNILKGDMRWMPTHRDGRKVDYRRG